MKLLADPSTLPSANSDKKHCKKELKKIKKELFSLQNKFYADGRFGLLNVLQGVDTSGKDVTFIHFIPLIAIDMAIAVLATFLYIIYLNDPTVFSVAAVGIILIIGAERLFMMSHTDEDGNMPMGMENIRNKK